MDDRPRDERQILNALGLFARVVDGKDWSRVREVFADDVVFDYGGGQDQQGWEALRATFSTFLDRCGPTQHLIGSVRLTWDGEDAVTAAYVQARHQGTDELAQRFFDVHGEYTDRWQHRGGEWRIARRDVRWFTSCGDPAVIGLA